MNAQTSTPARGQGYLVAARGQLSDEQLKLIFKEAIQKYSYTGLVWQSLTQYELLKFEAGIDCAACDEAQAFGPLADLHWKRETWRVGTARQHGWRVVVTGRAEKCPTEMLPGALDLSDYGMDEQVEVPLRGTRNPGQAAWFDLRIPRPIMYPLEPVKNAAMRLRIFKMNGHLEFVQITGLKAAG